METNIAALEALLDRAQMAKGLPGGKPFIVLPNNHTVFNVEHLAERPARKEGHPEFTRAASFVNYVNEQATEDSRLYVASAVMIIAVLDHHGDVMANWGAHRAFLNLTQTPEWKTWRAQDKQRKTQRDFAQFIEDNAEDIVEPKGADLLDLVREIKTSSALEITGEIDERGDMKGASFVLQTKTKAGAKGELELPAEFWISVSPYDGGDKIPIKARLHLEVCAPRMVLWYELAKVEQTEKAALEGIVKSIETDTKMTAWYGQP